MKQAAVYKYSCFENEEFQPLTKNTKIWAAFVTFLENLALYLVCFLIRGNLWLICFRKKHKNKSKENYQFSLKENATVTILMQRENGSLTMKKLSKGSQTVYFF